VGSFLKALTILKAHDLSRTMGGAYSDQPYSDSDTAASERFGMLEWDKDPTSGWPKGSTGPRGKTSSGKDIHFAPWGANQFRGHHKDWSRQDHLDAAEKHEEIAGRADAPDPWEGTSAASRYLYHHHMAEAHGHSQDEKHLRSMHELVGDPKFKEFADTHRGHRNQALASARKAHGNIQAEDPASERFGSLEWDDDPTSGWPKGTRGLLGSFEHDGKSHDVHDVPWTLKTFRAHHKGWTPERHEAAADYHGKMFDRDRSNQMYHHNMGQAHDHIASLKRGFFPNNQPTTSNSSKYLKFNLASARKNHRERAKAPEESPASERFGLLEWDKAKKVPPGSQGLLGSFEHDGKSHDIHDAPWTLKTFRAHHKGWTHEQHDDASDYHRITARNLQRSPGSPSRLIDYHHNMTEAHDAGSYLTSQNVNREKFTSDLKTALAGARKDHRKRHGEDPASQRFGLLEWGKSPPLGSKGELGHFIHEGAKYPIHDTPQSPERFSRDHSGWNKRGAGGQSRHDSAADRHAELAREHTSALHEPTSNTPGIVGQSWRSHHQDMSEYHTAMEQAHGNSQAMEDASDKMWGRGAAVTPAQARQRSGWTKEGAHQISRNRHFRDAALMLAGKNHARRHPSTDDDEASERFGLLEWDKNPTPSGSPAPAAGGRRVKYGAEGGGLSTHTQSDPHQLASDLRASDVAADVGRMPEASSAIRGPIPRRHGS